MPSSFQYPVERHRDLQRRWGRLFQQTVVPNEVRNLAGLKKITIDGKTLQPGENATNPRSEIIACLPRERAAGFENVCGAYMAVRDSFAHLVGMLGRMRPRRFSSGLFAPLILCLPVFDQLQKAARGSCVCWVRIKFSFQNCMFSEQLGEEFFKHIFRQRIIK